jgi:hypothetical protein
MTIRRIWAPAAASIAVCVALLVLALGAGPALATPEGERAPHRLQQRVTQLEDRHDVAALGRCYGRAQDVLYRTNHREGRAAAREAARPLFLDCFTPDAEITFTFFGDPATATTFDGLEEWMSFVLAFGTDNRITSTRHLIGNEDVVLTGRRTATLEAYGNTPHFQAAALAAPEPSNLVITGIYQGRADRTARGWRLTEFRIDAEEIQDVSGTYPFGFAPPSDAPTVR